MSSIALVPRDGATTPVFGEVRRGAKRIAIVLAYRQAVVRSGLKMLLDAVSDFTVVAEAATLDETRRCLGEHSPDVLVLDLDRTAGSSLEAIGPLVEEFPATSIVVMSAKQDEAFIRAAIVAGALGYVSSTETAGELTRTIRRAAFATSTPLADLREDPAERPVSAGPCELSPREGQVLGLIAIGYTNAEIAEQLGLSVRTIETHRSHIRDKLQRPTRAELVEYAFAHGIHQSDG